DDAQIYARSSMLKKLLSFYNCHFSNNESKELILQAKEAPSKKAATMTEIKKNSNSKDDSSDESSSYDEEEKPQKKKLKSSPTKDVKPNTTVVNEESSKSDESLDESFNEEPSKTEPVQKARLRVKVGTLLDDIGLNSGCKQSLILDDNYVILRINFKLLTQRQENVLIKPELVSKLGTMKFLLNLKNTCHQEAEAAIGDQLSIAKETGRRHSMGINMYPSYSLLGAHKHPLIAALPIEELIKKADGFLDVIPVKLYSRDVNTNDLTWNHMELSLMLEYVQAHVAPVDVDPEAGL
nr:plasma membrane ATPase 1-like [Tanacetum cinerariifolium]